MSVRALSEVLSEAFQAKLPEMQGFERRLTLVGMALSAGVSAELSKMGLKVPHSEEAKYVVYVLWVRGHSLTRIARLTGLRVKQLAGLVERGPYKNRSAMTDEARQTALDELRAIRFVGGAALDGGKLDSIDWKVLPLLEEQRNA